jgi:acetylornithine/succinyldiaminopimelate/putrescine aminotransferase
MMTAQEIIELERQYVLQTYKRPEFVLERGEGVWLYDHAGRQYLDAGSGIAVNSLGYQSQAIIKALQEGAGGLLHVSNLYHTAPHVLLARDLCQSSFADRVFFCNSGAEANEGALKFARKWARVQGHSDKSGFVAFSGSFHGRTMGVLAVTATEKYRTPFEPLIGNVTFGEFNNLDSARAAITPHTCAVLIEPVQGEGGVTPAEPEFLAGLRELCDEAGALLICDEVQCGLGRTGTLWAYEQYGVTPDIMTLAKPLAGGLPMGAILLTQCVADAIEPGDHGSTFAAGPLVCSVAQATFDQLSSPDFLDQVRRTAGRRSCG